MLEDWQSWSHKLFTLSLFLGLQIINSCPILTSFFSQENLALIPYIIPPGGTIPQNRGHFFTFWTNYYTIPPTGVERKPLIEVISYIAVFVRVRSA